MSDVSLSYLAEKAEKGMKYLAETTDENLSDGLPSNFQFTRIDFDHGQGRDEIEGATEYFDLIEKGSEDVAEIRKAFSRLFGSIIDAYQSAT